MPAEVWLLNPDKYPRTLATLGRVNFAWERAHLDKRRVDHRAFAETQLRGVKYNYLIFERFGVVEYTSESPRHTALYPFWNYARPFAELVELAEAGQGGKIDVSKIPEPQRPRSGQAHRIFITGVPDVTTGVGKAFYLELKDLNEEFPHVQFVIHRVGSFRVAFGLRFFGAVMDPYTIATKGGIILPSGKVIPNKSIAKHPKWTQMFGFTVHDLSGSPEKRLIYNIMSLEHARYNFTKLLALKTSVRLTEDTETPTSEMTYPQLRTSRALTLARDRVVLDTDKIECDTCSLSTDCKYAREGAVCSLPNTEGKSLGDMFRTRDIEQIKIALSGIVGKNADRLDTLMDEEESFGEYNPDATKLSSQVFTQGAQLAKLIDPALRGKVEVNVGIAGAAAVGISTTQNPKQLMAEVIKTLEQQGFLRSEITPQLISEFIQNKGDFEVVKIDKRRKVIDVIEPDVTDDDTSGPF